MPEREWRSYLEPFERWGMPPAAPTDIVLDPASPEGHRALYVTAFGRGVYKSVDDGRTWTLKE